MIGYGSQGHAHALNNQDSGNSVVVGARPDSRAWSAATADGVAVETVADATAQGDIVMVLVPDHVQAGVYRDQIAPNLRPGSMLMFAHGFSIRFGGDRALARRGRGHDRAQGPRPPGAPPVPRRHRRAGAGGRPPGRHRQRAGAGAGLRPRPGLCPRRPDRDDLHRGDRDRPVRRAGGALRRHHPAGQDGLRDAGRGRIPARDRLLRVPARAEADRRPDVGGRPRPACATRSPTRPSTATSRAARG